MGDLRIVELPYVFRDRLRGESKLDIRVALDFFTLFVAKLTHDTISYRFLLFCLIGLTGVAVHMAILQLVVQTGALSFVHEQVIATMGAITWNYLLNNAITYRDRRLTGWRFYFWACGFLSHLRCRRSFQYRYRKLYL